MKPRSLQQPPDVDFAEEAVELIRAWIVDKTLQVSLLPTIWREQPGLWGVLLADVARHVSEAIEKDAAKDKGASLAAIREAFVAEIEKPTSSIEGDFLRPN